MLYSNKDLKKLIIPLVIEQTLAIAVGMADTIMISVVGEAAVSGVSLVDTVNILLINIFSALATGGAVVMYVPVGIVSSKFGRKKVLIGACVAFIVLTVPAFLILNTSQFWPVLLVELAMCATLTANDGTLSSYLTETFPTSVRFTGFAFSFNLANAIFGGTASFIATGLIALTGSSIAPAWYMVGVAAIALVAMILSHENTDKDLNHI